MLPFSSRLLTINSNPPKRVGVLGSLAFSAWVTSTGNVWGKDGQSKLWHSSLLLFSWTPEFLSTLHYLLDKQGNTEAQRVATDLAEGQPGC